MFRRNKRLTRIDYHSSWAGPDVLNMLRKVFEPSDFRGTFYRSSELLTEAN
jgi:hypothetical protein